MKLLLITVVITFLCSCNEKKDPAKEQDTNQKTDSIIKDIDTVKTITDTVSYSELTLEEKREAFLNICLAEYNETGKKELGIRTLELGNPSYNSSLFMKKKSTIKYGDVDGIYPVIKLFIYGYNTENECNAPYKKWLECFESECDKIKEGAEMKAIKMPPMYFIKNKGSIIVLKYLCEHNENDWDRVKANLNKVFKEEDAVICEIGCGGPLTWIK